MTRGKIFRKEGEKRRRKIGNRRPPKKEKGKIDHMGKINVAKMLKTAEMLLQFCIPTL